jgi:hypothetical protein
MSGSPDKKLNKKAAARAPQPNNDKGTERDLGLVYRRTPRRQFAICNGVDEECVEHQECAPFLGFLLRFVVYTRKSICVKVF